MKFSIYKGGRGGLNFLVPHTKPSSTGNALACQELPHNGSTRRVLVHIISLPRMHDIRENSQVVVNQSISGA